MDAKKIYKANKVIIILYLIGIFNVFGGLGNWPLTSSNISNALLYLWDYWYDIKDIYIITIIVVHIICVIVGVYLYLRGTQIIKILGVSIFIISILSDTIANILINLTYSDHHQGTLVCPIIISVLVNLLCIILLLIEKYNLIKDSTLNIKNILMYSFTILFILFISMVHIAMLIYDFKINAP